MRRKNSNGNGSNQQSKVRYAVVGLGHIAQVAVLPAFKHARKNSQLAAFVSDDKKKIDELAKLHKVSHAWSYDQYAECLNSGEIDAVYIALPNNMHKDYTVKACEAGIHVLCEKPLAVTSKECQQMIDASKKHNVKLMTAYRLHFDPANMEVVEMVESGKIGEPRIYNSVFTMQVKSDTMQVKEENIRLKSELGGGPLYDIGIYCINAARYLFRAEPEEVTAFAASCNDPRFAEVDEMVSAILKFPDHRLASFVCSFGSSDVSRFQIVGTEGNIAVDPAFEYAEKLKYTVTAKGRSKEKEFSKHDQFAPELIHFSQAILEGKDISASGLEGLADVKIIEALMQSARSGRPVKLDVEDPPKRPEASQVIVKPAVAKPKQVKVEAAGR